MVRGPNLFSGYWPDGADGPDAEGWWATGDVAYADDEGDLHLVDRRTELILVSGFNVYPAEVEAVLAAHPGVAEAAVLGRPDPERGDETVLAYVVAAAGYGADAAGAAGLGGAVAGPVQAAGGDRVRAGAAAHRHRQGDQVPAADGRLSPACRWAGRRVSPRRRRGGRPRP